MTYLVKQWPTPSLYKVHGVIGGERVCFAGPTVEYVDGLIEAWKEERYRGYAVPGDNPSFAART